VLAATILTWWLSTKAIEYFLQEGSNAKTPKKRIEENDPEGVAFEYEVLE